LNKLLIQITFTKTNSMSTNVIPIGADHAGFILKGKIINFLESQGYQVQDFGCFSEDSIDYPDFAHPVAKLVEENKGMLGILICGSGNGINMTANKHAGIRSALCWDVEIASLARQHNDANIVALPARFISEDLALEIVRTFLGTEFEGGRHQRRIDKISC
jgi:ribose 5-phosphate isomerase B